MSTHPIPTPTTRPLPLTQTCPAKALPAQKRQRLALDALAGIQHVARLAHQHDVSRKFVSRQAALAQRALNDAFALDPSASDNERILFTIPVTKSLLRQIVLGLILLCHSSYRGVLEFLRDVFDFPLSLGTVRNIVHSAVGPARRVNDRQDLSGVRVGAHDEIYQANQPVLVGVCAESSYCYLLSAERHRDADTWGAHLLQLRDRGFAPEATVADQAGGLRAGQELALPEVPCRGDHFHLLQECQRLVMAVEFPAYQAIAARTALQRQQGKPGKIRDRQKLSLAQKLRQARLREERAVALADDVTLLLRWLREDVLAVAGPTYAERVALFDFLVAELLARASQGSRRLGEMCRALRNQRQDLLAFALELEGDLAAVAAAWAVSPGLVRELLAVQALPMLDPRRGRREAALRQALRGRYHGLSVAAAALARWVVRASSAAENFNSRLRNYFFLRRQLGPDYLALMQFFLNHRRFLRSDRPEPAGKSPAELLTGREHPHWLEMLGYQRFSRN